jgi:L,D-transpeptidase catalytic domain
VSERRIRVLLGAQRLELVEGESVRVSYPVSTSARGAGEAHGSLRTPRGRHEIRAKIGAGAPRGAVFVGRRPTGEICTPERAAAEPGRDWILSRILWLRGLERGRNRRGDVDTMRRHIYIHGTPDEARIGSPASHGCIRMRNDDVIELFDLVAPGTPVDIVD